VIKHIREIFMSLWAWLTGQVQGVATRPTAIVVQDDQVEPRKDDATRAKLTGTVMTSEKNYLRIWLREMFLEHDQLWFTQRYPAIHTLVKLQFGNVDTEIANLSGPSKLGNLSPPKLSQSVLLAYPLTALLPFRGGTVGVDAGLVSMQASNLVDRFTKVVGDFAAKLAVPQVSTAIDLAGPVAAGIQDLFGAGQANFRLYFRDTFSAGAGGSRLQSCFVFLSGHPDGTIPANQVWVLDGQVRIGSAAESAEAPIGQDYMLLQIESVDERDDYQSLSVIAEPLQLAVDAALGGEAEKAKTLLRAAKIATMRSQDLTQLDRRRVAAALDQHLSDITGVADVQGFVADNKYALAKAMAKAPTPREAELLPDVDPFA
jgi:hypothetical protein